MGINPHGNGNDTYFHGNLFLLFQRMQVLQYPVRNITIFYNARTVTPEVTSDIYETLLLCEFQLKSHTHIIMCDYQLSLHSEMANVGYVGLECDVGLWEWKWEGMGND